MICRVRYQFNVMTLPAMVPMVRIVPRPTVSIHRQLFFSVTMSPPPGAGVDSAGRPSYLKNLFCNPTLSGLRVILVVVNSVCLKMHLFINLFVFSMILNITLLL